MSIFENDMCNKVRGKMNSSKKVLGYQECHSLLTKRRGSQVHVPIQLSYTGNLGIRARAHTIALVFADPADLAFTSVF